MDNLVKPPSPIIKIILISFTVFLYSALLYWGVVNPPMGADSYVFTRLTKNLPNYSTSSSWIRVDRPDLHWEEDYMPDKIFEDAYEKPIWVHPPLANILAYPFVKLIPNERLLKIVPIILFNLSLYLIYLVLKDKLEHWKILICFVPISLMTVALYGVPYFYHDTFMIPLFALSLYLVHKGNKWKYLSASALVLTKTPAAIFLLPLAIQDYYQRKNKPGINWKMLLPGLAIIPYLIITWQVSGDPFYVMNHWSTMSYYTRLHYEYFLATHIPQTIIYTGLYIYAPILAYSFLRFRSNPYISILGIIGLAMASWAFIPYQMGAMLIATPLMLSNSFTGKRTKLENKVISFIKPKLEFLISKVSKSI